jgi:hypothetical protein
MRSLVVAFAVLAALPAVADGRQSFARALTCGNDGSAHVDGSLNVAVRPHVRARWSGRRIRSARAIATLRGAIDLRVTASAGASCGLQAVPVASWNAPPLRFMAGAVPVVVVPRVTVYLSAEARATLPATSRIRGTVSATAGLRWDGRVHPVGRFSQRLSADAPVVKAHASLGARVTPSVKLLLYGAAGPRFDFGTGLEFDAEPPPKLSVPVELSAGLRLPGLDVGPLTVLSRSIPLPLHRHSTPSAEGSERARIQWDTGADIDLHVWDAEGRHTSFRESGIPGLLLSKDDTDGFGPESVMEDDPAGRALTYGLCYFDGTGPTSVSVRSVDASGSVATSQRTLEREGDSALLGDAYRPQDGWCQPRH